MHIAHPAPTDEDIAAYEYKDQNIEIDDDGIIPILPDDSPLTDNARNRIVDFISTAFGAEKQIDNLNFLERALGKSVSDYLMKDFWKDHKKMYQNRPIYWLFSSKKYSQKNISFDLYDGVVKNYALFGDVVAKLK